MLQKFLGDILPPEGYYCLTLLPEGRHLWADSLDELQVLVERHAGREGVYYGTAAFQSHANRKQANVLSLQALRLDIDAGPEKLAKHGEDAVYATQKQAVVAAAEFFKATELVPTYLVSSGAGLHIYYCLDEAIDPEAWLSLAKGLSRLGAKHGLKIDASVTEDSARILRPIGALHGNGKRVAVLKDFGVKHSVAHLRSLLPVEDVLPKSTRARTGINDDLDLTPSGPPSSAFKIVAHCGALREAALSRGDVPEPFWRAMLGLVKRTTEGIEVAHEWSSGYEGYDPDEVERKFDAWATGPTTCTEFAKHSKACGSCEFNGKVKSPISLGLLTTAEVEALPEEQRPAAPSLPDEIKPKGMPWEGSVPPGFDVITDKHNRLTLVATITVEVESDTGEKVPTVLHVPVTHNIFWFSQWAEASGSEDSAQVTMNLWADGYVMTYMMDQSLVASQSKLLEFLAGKAIHTTSHNRATKCMQDYAKANILRMGAIGKRPKVNDHLGLRILPDGTMVCAHGAHLIYPDGSVQAAQIGPTIGSVANQFPVPLPKSVDGTWEPSVFDDHILPRARKHVEFLRRHYGGEGMEKFQLAIMLGLASPFMPFVKGEFVAGTTLPRQSSLSVSLYSRQSARGKTTAVASALLAYGRPADLVNDAGRFGSTDNARYSRLSVHGTMPNIMDEMGGATAASVATAVSQVANGGAKERSGRGGELRSSAPWSLINLMTTNTSQRDMISAIQSNSGAIQYRLLEINVEDMPTYDEDQRDEFTRDWAELNQDCIGALGAVIHREICALGVVGANKLVTECAAKAARAIEADQNARFQYWGLGAVFALQFVLTRLDLVPFDIVKIKDSFKACYDEGQKYVDDNVTSTDGLELMRQFLVDMAPNTLVTENETMVNRHTTRFDEPLNSRVPDKILARHIRSTKKTYVSWEALRAWAVDKGFSERDVVRPCRAHGVIRVHETPQGEPGKKRTVALTAEYYNLTKGLRGNMNLRMRCLTIDTRRLYLALGAPEGDFDDTDDAAEAATA